MIDFSDIRAHNESMQIGGLIFCEHCRTPFEKGNSKFRFCSMMCSARGLSEQGELGKIAYQLGYRDPKELLKILSEGKES